MSGEDRRVRKTYAALAKAMIELGQTEPYENITIKTITDRADVGYATFFRHYHEKDELLHDVVDDFITRVIQRLPLSALTRNPAEVGTELFRQVQEQAAICRLLLNAMHKATLAEFIVSKGVANFNDLPAQDDIQGIPAPIIANHLAMSAVALIQWYLDHGQPYPVERMGQIFATLIVNPILALQAEPQPQAR